ncbi:MAG TPA: NAD-dependent epimerase/dehydratase family protein, partial [Opitutus sp.]|nr:NAD-dependent epimerase/dehydratase family protein [Opitutus sp.]
MNRARVFLTGASGTVGSAVLEALVAAGEFQADCLARRPQTFAAIEHAGGNVVRGDMTDADLFATLAAHSRYEFIVHTAQAHYRDHSAEEIDRCERLAVSNLEKLRGPHTRLMVLTSGVWSHGAGAEGGPITEETPLRPFAAAALRARWLHELAASEAPWVTFYLPSMVYGTTGPVAELVRALRDGRTVQVLDDASVRWSVIERGDLGRAYVALLRHGRAGEAFVIAEPEPVSVV